ncbi:MAG: hypothetical protein VCB80_10285 [Deltaproteobacteria bacterium]
MGTKASARLGRTDMLVATALFFGGLAFLFSFAPLSRPAVLDPATWDLMSLGLLEGRIPYRDVFLHKTPGGALLGAMGATLMPRLPGLGLTAFEGAHALFIILGATGPALLFLICRRHQRLVVAMSAALLMVAFDQWPTASLEGVRPKVATTVFGLAALLAAGGGRAFTAGLAAGLSAMCWQPGLCYLGGAAWELLGRGPRAGTGRPLWSLLAGAAVAPGAIAIWLWSAGAAAEFIDQAIIFNLSYIDWHARSPAGTTTQLLRLARSWNHTELWLAPAALAGLVTGTRGRGPGPLTVAGILYLAMSFVSLQAWPDTIMFAPFVAAGLALGLARLITACAGHLAPERLAANSTATGLAALILLSALLAATPKAVRMRTPVSFDEQAAFISELEGGLGKDDPVLVIGFPEFSIHTGRRSLWPWPYMWFGVDRFVAERAEGGFSGMLGRLEEADPPLIIVARKWSGPLRRRFHDWARNRYRLEERFFYPHTKRPLRIYRRR